MSALEVTSESFDRCIRVNTKAVFFLCQVVARHLLKQGEIGGQHRSIINVTSSNAVAVSISRGEYCVSKIRVEYDDAPVRCQARGRRHRGL